MRRLTFDEVALDMVVVASSQDESHEGTVVSKQDDSLRIRLIVWGKPTEDERVIFRADIDSGAIRVFDGHSL